METKSAQPERLRAITLIFRFPAGLGTLRIHAGCRASSGLFPQPLLISCYSVVVKLVYHRFLAKSTIFRCAVQTVCTKVGQMRQRVWFWRRAFLIGGRWPRPRPRPDEGKVLLAAHRRVVASTRPSSVTFGDSFPLRGGSLSHFLPCSTPDSGLQIRKQSAASSRPLNKVNGKLKVIRQVSRPSTLGLMAWYIPMMASSGR